jgi:hypothetical protein
MHYPGRKKKQPSSARPSITSRSGGIFHYRRQFRGLCLPGKCNDEPEVLQGRSVGKSRHRVSHQGRIGDGLICAIFPNKSRGSGCPSFPVPHSPPSFPRPRVKMKEACWVGHGGEGAFGNGDDCTADCEAILIAHLATNGDRRKPCQVNLGTRKVVTSELDGRLA